MVIDTYNLADFGAFSWADGGKRERVIFISAVSKLAMKGTLGNTTRKREEPKCEEKKKCGTSRGRNRAHGGGRHSGQVPGSTRRI